MASRMRAELVALCVFALASPSFGGPVSVELDPVLGAQVGVLGANDVALTRLSGGTERVEFNHKWSTSALTAGGTLQVFWPSGEREGYRRGVVARVQSLVSDPWGETTLAGEYVLTSCSTIRSDLGSGSGNVGARSLVIDAGGLVTRGDHPTPEGHVFKDALFGYRLGFFDLESRSHAEPYSVRLRQHNWQHVLWTGWQWRMDRLGYFEMRSTFTMGALFIRDVYGDGHTPPPDGSGLADFGEPGGLGRSFGVLFTGEMSPRWYLAIPDAWGVEAALGLVVGGEAALAPWGAVGSSGDGSAGSASWSRTTDHRSYHLTAHARGVAQLRF